MYTRRYIPPHPDPWTVRPTMYNVRRSCGVHGTPGRRFWRRVGHKVTGSRSPYPSLPPAHRQRTVHRLPLLSRSVAARIGRVVKLILPGVKATRTSQKQYDFIANETKEKLKWLRWSLMIFREASAWCSSKKLATVSWIGNSVTKESCGIKYDLKTLTFQCFDNKPFTIVSFSADKGWIIPPKSMWHTCKLCVLSYN